MDKEYYLTLRNLYQPDNLKYIFILESPPVSGLYFYDNKGKKSEPLFAELMKLLKISVNNKRDGLDYFKKSGYMLIDATYRPIDRLQGKERNKAILDDFEELKEDLNNINPHKKIPLILVKANICRILEPRLKQEGYNVLNNGVTVPFPSTGQQKKFHTAISDFFKVL